MSIIYSFFRLPLELRQRIWALSMNPQDVSIDVVGRCNSHFKHFKSSTPAPALMLVCGESRSYLEAHYSKAFSQGWQPRYIWFNFYIDTIRINACRLCDFLAVGGCNSIRKLTIECTMGHESFCVDCWDHVRDLDGTSIETLTIIQMYEGQKEDLKEDKWWHVWHSFMCELYHRDDPVSFSAKIFNTHQLTPSEINMNNYCQLQCE